MTTRAGVIVDTFRVPSSANGNPRVCIALLQHGEFENFYWTTPDAQVANVIENSEFRNVPVVLELDDSSGVIGVEVS